MLKKKLSKIKIVFIAFFLILSFGSTANAVCATSARILSQAIVSPCWTCFFPLSFFAIEVVPGLDSDVTLPAMGDLYEVLCTCPLPPPIPMIRIGIPTGFFEPVSLVEIVKDPWCFEAIGAQVLWDVPNTMSMGTENSENAHREALYQAHLYTMPLFKMLGLFVDVLSLSNRGTGNDFEILYITEVDPTWNDDVLAAFEFPEASLFSNPIAQIVCVADCIASSVTGPLDPLFWCAGCLGSMYPFTGNTTEVNQGDVAVSSLMAAKLYAKMFRYGLEFWTSMQYELCIAVPTGLIVKSQYKFALLSPIPELTVPCCEPLGRSPMLWSLGKSYPAGGENFVYVAWRLTRMCLL